MGRKTTMKTPTTQGLSSMVVWPTFPSKGFTQGQMWWKSFFTIKLTLNPMEILLTVHVTWGPYHGCLHLLHACLKSLNFYMDPIRVNVHHETNLWQTQRNLVGMSECRWTDERMTSDDFLWLQDISCLNWKHKKGTWRLHKNATLSI